MEEIILNIDSRYRDIAQYPNESKFRINFEKTYKNITSAKILSSEINNNVSIISTSKNNNFITVYLPNKTSDDVGIKLELNDNTTDTIEIIKYNFNILLNK